jgi:hypothetical protein
MKVQIPKQVQTLLKDKNVLYIVFFLAITNLFGYLLMHNFEAVAFFLITGLLTSYFSKNMTVIMIVAMFLTNFLSIGRRVQYVVRESMTNKKDVDEDKTTKKDKEDKTDDTGSDDDLDDGVLRKLPEKTRGGDIKTKSNSKSHTTMNDDEDDEDDVDVSEDGSGVKGVSLDTTKKTKTKTNATQTKLEPVGKLNQEKTVETAYDQIDSLLSSGAIKNMSSDTQRLAKRQAELMKQMNTLTPMVENGMKTLEKLGGMEKMNSMIEGLTSIMNKFGGGKK